MMQRFLGATTGPISVATSPSTGPLRELTFSSADGRRFTTRVADLVGDLTTLSRSGREVWAQDAAAVSGAVLAASGIPWRSLNDFETYRTHNLAGEARRKRSIATPQRDALAARWQAVSGEPTPTWSSAWVDRALAQLSPNEPAVLAHYATQDILSAVDAGRRAASSGALAVAENDLASDRLWRFAAERGYRLDLNEVRRLQAEIASEMMRARQATGVDVADVAAVKRAMVAHGIVALAADDSPAIDGSGLPRLGDDDVAAFEVPAGQESFWAAIVRGREFEKSASKLRELSRAAVNGRVHPRISVSGAVTGRMTITKPAMQNFPGALRRVLLADDGMTLVGADLASVEPRIACILSGDSQMSNDLMSGSDVYCALAERIWHEPVAKNDPRRGTAKTALLATIYGQGTRALAAKLGLTLNDARLVRDGIDAAWPRFAAWRREVYNASQSGHTLHTLYGRRLTQPDKPHKAVNYLVQGSAADHFKVLTLAVDQALAATGLHAACWLPVHDELTLQVPLGFEQTAVDALRSHMTSTINGVTIDAAPVVLGPVWGHP